MEEKREFKEVGNLSEYLLDKLYEKGLNQALGENEEDSYSNDLYIKDDNSNYPVDGYIKIERLENKTIFKTFNNNDELIREEEFDKVIDDEDIYNLFVALDETGDKFYFRPSGTIFFKLDEDIKDKDFEIQSGTILGFQIGDTPKIAIKILENPDNNTLEELVEKGWFEKVLKSDISGLMFEIQQMEAKDIIKPFTKYSYLFKVMSGYNTWYNEVYIPFITKREEEIIALKQSGNHKCSCGHNHHHDHSAETNPLVEQLKSTLQEGFNTLKNTNKEEAKELLYNFIDQLTK